jgi:hypothetical protein
MASAREQDHDGPPADRIHVQHPELSLIFTSGFLRPDVHGAPELSFSFDGHG